ncbi:hypothetical protein LIER_00773 [Lithospermum erythrorhizon]|uniref:Replication factor A C-terminal domain-containing protein n=1 Tax=Lithospermum erythrorhizon TaxID=34254 RepID=A0AAV3NIK8_LITER
MVEHYGPILTAAAASFSVVERLYLQTSLAPLIVDPPLCDVSALKSWFDTVREMELPALLDDYSIAFAKDLVDRNIVRKYSVGEIQTGDQCGDFWTRSFLQLTPGEQSLYYIGCGNCFTKVNAEAGVEYHCLLCDKDVMSTIRPRVSVDAYDHSGRVTAGVIEMVAEQILNCTATQLKTFVLKGVEYDLEPVRVEFHDKIYLVLLQIDTGSLYTPTNVLPVELTPSKTDNITEGAIEISPLKRQLESVTIKTGSPVKKALLKDTPTPSEDTSCTLETPQDGRQG